MSFGQFPVGELRMADPYTPPQSSDKFTTCKGSTTVYNSYAQSVGASVGMQLSLTYNEKQ